MRMISLISLISIVILSSVEGSKEVSCNFYYIEWFYFNRNLVGCKIENQTIDEEGFVILESRDESVEGLSIEHNENIKFLPENIADTFPNLIGLEVWNCSVKSVERRHFKNLRELKELIIAYNKVKNVDSEAFKDQGKLERLQLTFNRIENLNSETFSHLSNLIELRLGSNKIKVLSQNLFKNLINVKDVSLANNQLESVEKKLFSKCVKLERVWLEGNKIKFLNAETFDGLTKLNYVDLRANVCVNEYYFKHEFSSMRIDFNEKCSSLDYWSRILLKY